MGSNLKYQLGIGKHHIQALQPMHVSEFDGKNISLIETGQYHNAVYADGELYTWGWGIYGQLGHRNVFMQDRPHIVQFFKDKVRFSVNVINPVFTHLHAYVFQEVRQISLGHAHSLVLCNSKDNVDDTCLYVFGCVSLMTQYRWTNSK